MRAQTAALTAARQAAADRAAREVAAQVARDRDTTRRAVLQSVLEETAGPGDGRAARIAAQAFPAPRRSAEDGREQLTPDGATGYVGWQSRPHGAVPDARLAARIGQADREAVVRAARAEQWQQQADQLDQLIRAGAGPAQQALQEQHAALQARAAAVARAGQERAAERAVREQARQAWQQAAQLREQARRNPIMLRLSGTSRRQLRGQADQQQQHGRALDAQADRHARAAQQAAAQATGPGGWQRAAEDLAEVTGQWAQRLAGAVGRDYATAHRYRQQADTDQQAAQSAARTAAGLRAETTYRTGLTPAQARAEQTSREHAARQAIADRNARADRSTPAAGYGYHRDLDHGPDLSL